MAKLSGGQRQAIAVARSVYSDAKILLLDEPLAAMGAKEGALILDLVRDLKARGDVSVIIIAHNYGQILEVCDRINLLQHGDDHLRQADLPDVGAGADRPGRGRVPRRPDREAAARAVQQRATGARQLVRALVVEGPGAAAVSGRPRPGPGAGGGAGRGRRRRHLRLRPRAAGRPATGRLRRYPVVPGHEWAGRVLAVGPEVRDLAPGDPVVAEGLRSCGVCDRCAEGRTNLCTAGYAETGFTLPGALAERLAVPARLVHRLPRDRPLEPAALLEPAACVASALLEAGMPLPGTRVAVVGDGPLGLLALLLLRTVTPAELVLIGGRPARSAFGPGCGATLVVAATDQVALDGMAGRFDAVVEATNYPAGAATALALLRRGGTGACCLASPAPGSRRSTRTR